MSCLCYVTMVTFPGCDGTFQGYRGNTINCCLYYVSFFPGCNLTCVYSYLSVCLPVCASSYLSICLSVHLCVYLSVCLPVCGSDHLPGPSVQAAGGGDSDRHQRRRLIGWRLPSRWHHDHQRPRQRPGIGRPEPSDRAQRRQVGLTYTLISILFYKRYHLSFEWTLYIIHLILKNIFYIIDYHSLWYIIVLYYIHIYKTIYTVYISNK